MSQFLSYLLFVVLTDVLTVSIPSTPPLHSQGLCDLAPDHTRDIGRSVMENSGDTVAIVSITIHQGWSEGGDRNCSYLKPDTESNTLLTLQRHLKSGNIFNTIFLGKLVVVRASQYFILLFILNNIDDNCHLLRDGHCPWPRLPAPPPPPASPSCLRRSSLTLHRGSVPKYLFKKWRRVVEYGKLIQ